MLALTTVGVRRKAMASASLHDGRDLALRPDLSHEQRHASVSGVARVKQPPRNIASSVRQRLLNEVAVFGHNGIGSSGCIEDLLILRVAQTDEVRRGGLDVRKRRVDPWRQCG